MLIYLEDAVRSLRRAQEACQVSDADSTLQRRAAQQRASLGRIIMQLENLGTIVPRGYAQPDSPDGPHPVRTRAFERREAQKKKRDDARKSGTASKVVTNAP